MISNGQLYRLLCLTTTQLRDNRKPAVNVVMSTDVIHQQNVRRADDIAPHHQSCTPLTSRKYFKECFQIQTIKCQSKYRISFEMSQKSGKKSVYLVCKCFMENSSTTIWFDIKLISGDCRRLLFDLVVKSEPES